jgi:hypothetical protein
MLRTTIDCVKYTGAQADSILIGISKLNKGLLIRVEQEQEKSGSRIEGKFTLLDPGDGLYYEILQNFTGKTFATAADLMEQIRSNGGEKCTHILNRGCLRVSAEGKIHKAFVAMPFHHDLEWVYEFIEESCQKFGVNLCRVDKLLSVENIWLSIVEEIENCDIFIADLSPDPCFKDLDQNSVSVRNMSNTNVATEAGYARALGKPIVLLTSEVESLPLDWRTKLAIVYPKDQTEKTKLEFAQKILERQLQALTQKSF